MKPKAKAKRKPVRAEVWRDGRRWRVAIVRLRAGWRVFTFERWRDRELAEVMAAAYLRGLGIEGRVNADAGAWHLSKRHPVRRSSRPRGKAKR